MASEDLPTRIRFQIEYYFSPKNLLRPDKFILSRLRYEEDGKVTIPLKTIADFKKVKELTEDLQVVAAALEGSEIMEVHNAGEAPELLLKHIRPAPRKTVTLREVSSDATEAQIRAVFGGAEPTSVRSISADVHVWHATFDTEVLAKQAADSADGAEVGGTAVSAKLKVEGPIYIRPEDEVARKAMKHKVSKKIFLPIAMRPLLIGHRGRNIRKLQEQIKSLEVDTNPDDPDNITVKADSEEHLAEAIDLIDKFFRPPEEGGNAEGLPPQHQQHQQHHDADMPAWGGGGGPPPAPALPLSSGLPFGGGLPGGMGGGGFPPSGPGAGGLQQNMLLQQQLAMGGGLGGMPGQPGMNPPGMNPLYMQNLQQIRFQQQLQQQQSTQALFRALQQNQHQQQLAPGVLEQNLARMGWTVGGGQQGGVNPAAMQQMLIRQQQQQAAASAAAAAAAAAAGMGPPPQAGVPPAGYAGLPAGQLSPGAAGPGAGGAGRQKGRGKRKGGGGGAALGQEDEL